MDNVESIINTTHILDIDGEKFPIYHQDRRLYKFVDWQDARNKLIKIMLVRVKNKTGEATAYIDFKMANPMRKTRLGNFFIDLIADVMLKGKSLGTLEELGLKKIFSDNYQEVDEEEIKMRKEIESKHSIEQYNQELEIRMNSLSQFHDDPLSPSFLSLLELEDLSKLLMKNDGWSEDQDNRIHARRKRSLLKITNN